MATKVELFELIRQPGLILAVPAPGQLCLAGARRRRDDRLWVAGSGTGYSFASSAVMGPFPRGRRGSEWMRFLCHRCR
jgi:hypothetical protein